MDIKKLLFSLSIFLCSTICFSQNPEIDSLKKALSVEKKDSAKVNILLNLSQDFFSSGPGEAINYAVEAKNLASKINYLDGLARAYKYIGIAYYMQGNFLASIDNYVQSLAIFRELNDKNGIANILSNEGAVYFNQADDEKALELYLKALPMSESINNKDAIGIITGNIGEIYLQKGEDKLALNYFKKSLAAYEDSTNIPYSLNNIGKVYEFRNEYNTAIKYHQSALDLAKKLNAKVDMAQSLLGLGNTYRKQGNTSAAIEYYKRAEPIAKGISNTNLELKNTYDGLAKSYAQTSDFSNAFKYQTLFTNIKDSIYNIDIEKKMTGLQFNFDIQKKEAQIDLLKKDQVLQELDINRQKLIMNALFIGLSLLLIIAVILYRNYRNKIKINNILDSQNAKIEHLLLNILPEEVAQELQKNGAATPRYYDKVTVLFTDFKGFSLLSKDLSPQEVVTELNECFMAFDDIIEKYNLEKIKTIGDSYMCAGGIPTEDDNHLLNIIKASLEMQKFISRRNAEKRKMDLPEWNIRIGVNTGPIVAGVVGRKKYAYDIWGATVNIASRMESNGEPGRVNISSATYEMIKEEYECTYRGKIFAKNIGEIDMYFIENEVNSNRLSNASLAV
jgi:adenylate cyclase